MLNIPRAPGCRIRDVQARRSGLLRIAGTLGILLLALDLGCSTRSSHEPVTLTFLDLEYDVQDRLPGLAQDLRDFTRETGIHVRRLPGPDGSLNQLALWQELLRKGAGTPEVCNIDVIWSAILGQYLMDLKPHFATGLYSQNPVVLAAYTVDRKLVAIPHHAYAGVLLYRADLLQRYRYREPPKTWDELETMAARIQAGERAKGAKNFWGYVWEGGPGEDLTCSGLEWQMSEGGGRIVEDDQTISVNNPQAIRSWQRAAHWVGTISPPSVVAYGKWDAENMWSQGNAAFLRSWASDYSLISLQKPPGNATRFGITSVPGSAAGRASALGGNGLAVPLTSAHPAEALRMIEFLRRRDVQSRRAREHAEPPREQELFELPVILEPYPQLAKLGRRGGDVVARPSIVTGRKYEDVTRAYIRAVHSVLTGEKLASVAAADLEKQLARITGFRPGPPFKRDLGGR